VRIYLHNTAVACLLFNFFNSQYNPINSPYNPTSKIHKAASIVCCSNEEELYHRLTQLCNPSDFVLGLVHDSELLLNTSWTKISHPVSQMMVADVTNYLVDDILVKVDRAAMSVGLETRVPLLDHRIYEFASKLPYTSVLLDCSRAKLVLGWQPKVSLEAGISKTILWYKKNDYKS